MKKWGILAKLGVTLAIATIFFAMLGVSFLLWVMFIKLCVRILNALRRPRQETVEVRAENR